MVFRRSNSSKVQSGNAELCPVKKSVVQVRFPGRDMALSYYNDRFDLKVGDLVYVDGKLEGQLGRITEINYNFKIKIADYKKVIAVADTEVYGQLYMAGSHFIAFDPDVIPAEKILTWFQAPPKEDEEFASGNDESSFLLDELKDMNISSAVAERGLSYYVENHVSYICVDHGHGFAIVEGSKNYIVEFLYTDGRISHLTCECPCSYTCKHEFAAMLQLQESLQIIGESYAQQYASSDYFAAIRKSTVFLLAIDRKKNGSLIL